MGDVNSNDPEDNVRADEEDDENNDDESSAGPSQEKTPKINFSHVHKEYDVSIFFASFMNNL